jgi:hypothetical protein
MGQRAFDPELGVKICEQLAQGRSLRAICRDEGMPPRAAVHQWIIDNKDFADQYARAKAAGIDELVDESIEIADDATNDWMEQNDPDNPGYKFNGEHAQRSRLRVDTRKWYASKLAPKLYGDRLDIGNADGEAFKVDGGHLETSDVARLLALIPILEARAAQEPPDDHSDIA